MLNRWFVKQTVQEYGYTVGEHDLPGLPASLSPSNDIGEEAALQIALKFAVKHGETNPKLVSHQIAGFYQLSVYVPEIYGLSEDEAADMLLRRVNLVGDFRIYLPSRISWLLRRSQAATKLSVALRAADGYVLSVSLSYP